MTNTRFVRGRFDGRKALETAMDNLKKIGVGRLFIEKKSGRYEVLKVEAPDEKLLQKICDTLLRCGGRDVSIGGDEVESEFISSYRDYSLRSRLDPDRLTDI